MNIRSITKSLIAVAAGLLVACSQPHHHQVKHDNTPGHMVTYRDRQDDNSWMYWYILFNHGNTYYYSSSSPLDVSSKTGGYSSVPFVKAPGGVVSDGAAKAIQKGEAVKDEQVDEENIPEVAEHDVEVMEQAEAQAEDAAAGQAEQADGGRTESNESSNSTESSGTSSSESSSSSDGGSSGGGDSGGGGSSGD